MRELLNLIYRQDMDVIFWGAFVCTVGFLELRKRWGHCRRFRWGCILALMIWVYALLRLTVLNRTPGDCTERYWLPLRFLWEMHVTGNTELARTMFMNTALFYPAGLLVTALLPRTWSRRRTIGTVCGMFLAVSMSAELTQLVMAFGRAEMDDMLFNTAGAYLGALPILADSE